VVSFAQHAAGRAGAAVASRGRFVPGILYGSSDGGNLMVFLFCLLLFITSAVVCMFFNPPDELGTAAHGMALMEADAAGAGVAVQIAGPVHHDPFSARTFFKTQFKKVFHFPQPSNLGLSAVDAHIPAMCPQMLGMQDKHLPLLVPFAPISQPGLWRIPVLSGHERRPLLEARLVESGIGAGSLGAGLGSSLLRLGKALTEAGLQRRVVEIHEGGGQRRLLASIDSAFHIRGPGRRGGDAADGLAPFGQLEHHDYRFVLRLRDGRPMQWALVIKPDGSLCVFWYTKGVPLYTLNPTYTEQDELPQEHIEISKDILGRLAAIDDKTGQGSPATEKAQLLATIKRGQNGHGDCLEVLTVPGIDAILVLLCALGVLAFDPRLAPQKGAAGDPLDQGVPSWSTQGTAASLSPGSPEGEGSFYTDMHKACF